MSYPSDISDRQWEILREHMLFKRRGPKVRESEVRKKLNGMLYVLRSGCQWRMLPKDYGAWSCVYAQYQRWQKAGVLERIHDALRRQVREQAGKSAAPSVVIIDSQSVKTVQKGGSAGATTARRSTAWHPAV